MRGFKLVCLGVVAGCSRAPAPAPGAPVATVEPVEDIAITAPPLPAPPAAPRAGTRLVSHMVDGKVFIEEVPLEEAAPADAVAPSGEPAQSNCQAACAALGEAIVGAVAHRMVAAARVVESQCAAQVPDRRELARRLEERAAKAAPADCRSMWAAAAALEPSANRWMRVGEAADAENDGPAAVDAYRRAAALAPGDRDVKRELAEAERRHTVEQRFDTIAQEHFSARFEGAEKKDLAWDALRVLDEAWRGVGTALDLRPGAPVTVVFYTGAAYEDATGAQEWSAGQFDGKIRVRSGALKQGPGALRDLLFHEYVHAALHTSVKGRLPAWLHEGLAQRLEPGLDRTKDLAPLQGKRRADLPTLAVLSEGFGRIEDRAQVRLHYACALDLVDELARWRGERSFVQLFAAMNAGKSFEDALDATYGLDERLLQERWQSRY